MNFSTLNPKLLQFAFVLCFCGGFNLYADVIYLRDGSIILAGKAWEEGGEIRYTTSQGSGVLPKSSVLRIQEEKENSLAPRSAGKWNIGVGDNDSQGQGSVRSVPNGSSSAGSAFSKEALGRLRENLRADPTDVKAKAELVYALNSVATLEITQGDLLSARSSLDEALKLDRRNPVLLSNLAMIDLRLGNYPAAEDLLKSSLAIDNKSQWTRYLLGQAYYGQEKISEAIGEWRAALDLGPNDEVSKRLEKAEHEAGAHDELGVLHSAHFVLRYDKKIPDYGLGQEILSTLEDLYNQLSRDLTTQAPATVAVILYPDRSYFEITQAPDWSGGIFDGKIRLPTRGLTGVSSKLRSTLMHELTHSFIASLPGRGSPTWFLEGIAQLEEGKSAASHRTRLAELQQGNRLAPLKNLRGSFLGLSSDAAGMAYVESLSAVEYMSSRFGRPAIRNLLDLMAQNYNFENSFRTVLLETVSDFEAAWQRDLTQ